MKSAYRLLDSPANTPGKVALENDLESYNTFQSELFHLVSVQASCFNKGHPYERGKTFVL